MRSLSSHFMLIDLHTSFHTATQIPTSTFSYLNNSNFPSTLSAAFRRTRRERTKASSSRSPIPPIPAPEIRRPNDWAPSGNGSEPVCSGSGSVSELESFLELLPLKMRGKLCRHEEIGSLVEIVMDLGRQPLARFPTGDWVVDDEVVKVEDLKHAISKVGEFSDDNRSGIDHSLHRISAIRNRKKQIIGLTCRVGRAVSGSAEIIRDLVEGGGSILVIGPPGVGKTTLIREIARMLADECKKRVVIIDTSNEIGGDGDVPHPGIGRARRMQVPNVHMQHNVMIEAVENHMPETIIIDEIGTELEALAASTIAQRGVQLVATAHGVTIESIVKNPCLQMLVGGIESVTLGDDEARKRKVQKTILERKGPPTFSCAVEMISRSESCVHHRLDATVDAILAGKSPLFEVRSMETEPESSLKPIPAPVEHLVGRAELPDEARRTEVVSDVEDVDEDEDYFFTTKKLSCNILSNSSSQETLHAPSTPKSNILAVPEVRHEGIQSAFDSDEEDEDYSSTFKKSSSKRSSKRRSPVYVYTYKILEADLQQVAMAMGLEMEIDVTDDVGTADAILASSYEMKQNPWIRTVAKFHKLPVFVIKSNTMAQMVKAIRMILGMDTLSSKSKQTLKSSSDIEIEDDSPQRKPSLEEIDALEEVRLAIEYIVIPSGEPVELLPRCTEIVARQLELVRSYQLVVENSGTDSNPRLQILPQNLNTKTSPKYSKPSPPLHSGGGGSSVSKLRLLPE